MKRVFLIVLDSLGIGSAPDAKDFSDEGANTLKSAYNTGKLNVPTLIGMGLSGIEGVDYLESCDSPTAIFGRMCELSRGKDTTIGHWEIAGIVSEKPLPTYPDGFPYEIIEKFSRAVGRGVLCNAPYSGTDVIRDFGKEHLESGDLIVYTSADSVFQIAAHEDVVPTETLYKYCEIARDILVGEHAVGRVIARPFVGEVGNFKRTANRRDFSLKPPKRSMLDAICESGLEVISVGKINDIFLGQGITKSYPTHSNSEGMKITDELVATDFSGLAFINLVDFDMLYGHRQDALGYAEAICEFDGWLSEFIKKLTEDDTLIITADHGCDPSDSDTDHTREYVPLLVFGSKIKPRDVGTCTGFGTVARAVTSLLGVGFTPDCYTEIF